MPISLIYTEGKTVFMQFDRIIDQGLILVYNPSNHLVLQKEIRNTNFEKFDVNGGAGNFYIKLIVERDIITKKISIN